MIDLREFDAPNFDDHAIYRWPGYRRTHRMVSAISLMLDFKCVINPYNVHVPEDAWDAAVALNDRSQRRLRKSMHVMMELGERLVERTYTSGWEI